MKCSLAHLIGGFGGLGIGVLEVTRGVVTGMPITLRVLLGLMLVDLLSGLSASGWRAWSSQVSHTGLQRKVITLLLVATGVLLDCLVPTGGQLLGSSIAGAFCLTEAISIVENANRGGVTVPRALLDFLERLKRKGDA